MNRVFYRHLVRSLLWLLVAALPLQGFAAAMRTCCLQQDSGAQAVAIMAAKAAAPHCHDMADPLGQWRCLYLACYVCL